MSPLAALGPPHTGCVHEPTEKAEQRQTEKRERETTEDEEKDDDAHVHLRETGD